MHGMIGVQAGGLPIKLFTMCVSFCLSARFGICGDELTTGDLRRGARDGEFRLAAYP